LTLSDRLGSPLLRNGERLFGTDGIRGVANTQLTAELALELGRAAGSLLTTGPVLVGRDTRRSGEMLSASLQAGFQSAGIDTVDAGVLPSGGISQLTAGGSATMGAIVSASHNPAEDNGIKLLAADGTKLADAREDEIERRLRNGSRTIPLGAGVGTRFPLPDATEQYVGHLARDAEYRFRGISVVLDCANGAAYRAAPALFDRLGADVEVLAADPDGTNINLGCGSTHPEFVTARSAGRVGLAFDGDADRLVAVDEIGEIVDGDAIMAIVARHWKAAGRLTGDMVVATVMSNLGFRKSMDEAGIRVVETRVGDRYVLEAMREHRAVLGGEQSGHIIFLDRGRTGDGLLTAVRLLEVMAGTGKPLAELRAAAMRSYPQVLHNVRVAARDRLATAGAVWDAVEEVERSLGADGRVLVRASGTEPLVRVMVEASTDGEARRYAEALADVVSRELGEG
jgi:phosphoglucosamine mutase